MWRWETRSAGISTENSVTTRGALGIFANLQPKLDAMRRRTLLLMTLLLPTLLGAREPGAEFDKSHESWSTLLKAHMVGSKVKYAALKEDRADLDLYVKDLGTVTLAEFDKWSRGDKYAFWINAYNAFTVQLIVDHYPLKSITDIKKDGKDAWNSPLAPLGHLAPKLKRARLTLNDIENEILRPTYKDPRIHAAVNCAAISCPPLAPEAFRAEDLEKQLNRQTDAWLADKTRNQFDKKDGRVKLSKIFEWYADDFKLGGRGPAMWLAKNAPREHREWLATGDVKVEYLEYDWKLNDASR